MTPMVHPIKIVNKIFPENSKEVCFRSFQKVMLWLRKPTSLCAYEFILKNEYWVATKLWQTLFRKGILKIVQKPCTICPHSKWCVLKLLWCKIFLIFYNYCFKEELFSDLYWPKLAQIEVCSLARKISNDSMISA